MNKTKLTLSCLILFCGIHTLLFAAEIKPVVNGDWQDNTTWDGGQLPGVNDEVVIPEGFDVSLTGTIEVKSITVQGILRAQNQSPIHLKTEWMLVMGANALFEVGTNAQPYTNECTITLVGINDGQNNGMGDKFIGAMNGGTIELHGKEKISWTHLGASVSAGVNQITMSEAVDWEAGDEIVVVSSRLDWEEAEKRSISAISADGKTITLDSNLNYPHVGTIETYTRQTDNKTWTADLRAEVGLLTHNVKIQGDAQSDINGFGGHIMAMMGSTMNASSIELYRMGQKAILGKYPWHWHLLHEFGNGQYFKNSSVHKSYNRAITIHGTSYVTVENNFFYDHIGHGVFLEDGSERYNTIKDNVVLLSKRPEKGEELTPSDNQFDEPQNRTPSSFWITNPNNIFKGNVVAGTEGTGYWFAFPTKPMGASATDARFNGIQPHKEPLGLFENNKAHSCMSGFDIFDHLNASHTIIKNRGWENSDEHIIRGCTWYANNLALYSGIGGSLAATENLIFDDNVLTDNKTAIMLASYSQVQESVIGANSGNGIIDIATKAYRTYDGAGQVRDCHLVGWNGPNVNYIAGGGAATKHTNHRISGITTDDGLPPVVDLDNYDTPLKNNDDTPQSISHVRVWNTVLYDEDGSFSGQPESSVVSNHPMMLVGDEYQHSNWSNAYRSSHKFAFVVLRFDGLERNQSPNATIVRTKTDTPTAYHYDMYGYKDHIMMPVIVKENFMYTYTFETLPEPKNVSVVLDDATIGDNVILRFTDFGKLDMLTLRESEKNLSEKASLENLENSNTTAYYVEPNGDLYLKYVATTFKQDLDIDWSTSFEVPLLDTDGDGVSDRDEIGAGTNPFTDAPLYAKPNLLAWDFDNNVEGWSGNTKNLSATWNSSGYLDCTPSGDHPHIYNDDVPLFTTDNINYLEVRVKNGTSNTQGRLYLFRQSSGSVFIPFTMTPNASKFETILVDLSMVNNWTNDLTVKRMRLDPNSNGDAGTISFDHIYLMKTDDKESLSSSNPKINEVNSKVYPNPVRKGQDVRIQLSNRYYNQEGQVTVYDMQGRPVFTKKRALTETIQLPTHHLNEGFYMVVISDGYTTEIFKLLVN